MYCIFHIFTLLLLLVCWFSNCEGMKEPDCSKMVFHPKCRGISAKRSSRLPIFDETEEPYNTDDSLEEPYWKSNVDSDLMERIMKDIIYANKKYKNHPKAYYEEEI
ncbi:uncharacterized protein LOC129971164 [Argiope bruennichi]|uniref:Uncharacterized protein n=1 Tax=Argiope bruennichi TaxID=94029 RepID=A0A8T0E1D3_ARGBR|nr:uncharacterized protein LOC129971164 [Argiope bruennichi]XP_055940667.1 uncharacterized protein LOC129971164 [Argiope bruennichi]XP_055940678.1 uncharacterized protein LOC129971164 [Argiope bruennichi]XP_055940685.1 uncharacterized protein LOC129971164 [Argiope bruennichi]KAF8764608.1 hypothetical protein HNY73_022668 [Argiope bruennichi]